eukprot:2840375-Prymnesium_polylepis.1
MATALSANDWAATVTKQTRVLDAVKEQWEQLPTAGEREEAKFNNALMRHPEFYKDGAFVAALDCEDNVDPQWRKIFLSPQFSEQNWEKLDHYAILDEEYTVIDAETSPEGELLADDSSRAFLEQLKQGYYIFPFDELFDEEEDESTGNTLPEPDSPIIDGLRIEWSFDGKSKVLSTVRTRTGCGDALIPANKVIILGDTSLCQVLKPEDIFAAIKSGDARFVVDDDDKTREAERAAVVVRDGFNVTGMLFGMLPMESFTKAANAHDARID